MYTRRTGTLATTGFILALLGSSLFSGCADYEEKSQFCSEGVVCPGGKKCTKDGKGCMDADATCGNGTREGDEVCDEGDLNDGGECSSDCKSNYTCGNKLIDGVVTGAVTRVDHVLPSDDPRIEECDDGTETATCNQSPDAAKSVRPPTDCKRARCGDRYVNKARGEVCDDGNEVDGDGCSHDCLSLSVCGNKITDPGEVCDDGNFTPGDGCSADCKSDETCGNGTVDAAKGEICDDDNTVGGDGCSANCKSVESCSNGVVDSDVGEVCDDSNVVPGDGCSANCRSNETCGDEV